MQPAVSGCGRRGQDRVELVLRFLAGTGLVLIVAVARPRDVPFIFPRDMLPK